MITKMVARWQQAADDADLEAKAAELGYSPNEIMTIASLIEAEGRGEYRAKIARVIYNRLRSSPTRRPASCRSTRASTTRSAAAAPP